MIDSVITWGHECKRWRWFNAPGVRVCSGTCVDFWLLQGSATLRGISSWRRVSLLNAGS